MNKIYIKKKYSILILDISCAMVNYYALLFIMANEIITNQMKNKHNKDTVILFGKNAMAEDKENYRLFF